MLTYEVICQSVQCSMNRQKSLLLMKSINKMERSHTVGYSLEVQQTKSM